MAPGPVTTRPRHRPARWTASRPAALASLGQQHLARVGQRDPDDGPGRTGGRETAFQGLDRAANLSELHVVATATNLGGLGLGRAQ